jgi:hypothetical protein
MPIRGAAVVGDATDQIDQFVVAAQVDGMSPSERLNRPKTRRLQPHLPGQSAAMVPV